jgi:hypothetical protein
MSITTQEEEKYPELRKIAWQIARDTATRISKEANEVESEMPYKAQWILEEVVDVLKEAI